METIYRTIKSNGEYSCGDIGISTAKWFELLKDSEAVPYLDVLYCFLRESEHTSTCSKVSLKYGKPAAHYNSKITNFSKWVQKKLNNFRIVGTDGNDTYWCITMQRGWNSKQGFQWQLRDELANALQSYLMEDLINQYRSLKPFNEYEEEYKWELLDNTEGKDVLTIIKSLRGQNIVDNARVDSVLKSLWETKSDELAAIGNRLLDESIPINERLANFKQEMRSLCPSDWKTCANDERTAAAILMCKYPEKYTVYKDEIYQLLCQYFGFDNRKTGLKFSHFTEIINRFAAEYGEVIQQIMLPQIGRYRNKPLNLAVQTLFWCMRNYMNTEHSTNKDMMPQQKYREYIELLQETHNLVLTGAPGTGKTFMAHEIAKEMGAETQFVQFHPSYDYTDFVEGLRPVEKNNGQIGFERKDGVFKEFCKKALKEDFDTAYSKLIKDIENGHLKTLKTKTKESANLIVKGNDCIYWYSEGEKDNISSNCVSRERLRKLYERYNTIEKLETMNNVQEGIKSVIGGCDSTYYWAALNHILTNNTPNKPFVFIIDEINRGEVSKIFGELFYAIDPGYRGKNEHLVQTQYQNLVPETDVFAKGFYVPENVFILATMNDIDRSVESMDFAMRRRFTWKEVTPTDTQGMLAHLTCAAKAKATMTRLNEVIAETDGLGASYMIGPSYFLKLNSNGEDFKKLWNMNIEPLLKEYLRGFRKASEILDKFEAAYFDFAANSQQTDTTTELIDED